MNPKRKLRQNDVRNGYRHERATENEHQRDRPDGRNNLQTGRLCVDRLRCVDVCIEQVVEAGHRVATVGQRAGHLFAKTIEEWNDVLTVELDVHPAGQDERPRCHAHQEIVDRLVVAPLPVRPENQQDIDAEAGGHQWRDQRNDVARTGRDRVQNVLVERIGP
jgi:hypothetical protein